MKVWIRERIYDANDEPIVVYLSKKDKKNIKNMCKSCDLYCEYPDKNDTNKIIELLSDIKKIIDK